MRVHIHSIIISTPLCLLLAIQVSEVPSPVVIRKKPHAFGGEIGVDLPAPGQPRKEDGSSKTTKRPNINRLKFPSVGVIPGEGTN